VPTTAEHFAAAGRNQRTLSLLLASGAEHNPWVAVVAFYKALHLVEGVFFEDHDEVHTFDHWQRGNLLKRTNRYALIYKSYRPLAEAAFIARYLLPQGSDADSPVVDFSVQYSPEIVQSRLIGHYLHQIEQGVTKFVAWPPDLARCV